MKFPFAEAFDNGVLRLPPHYDTAQYVTPGPGIDHVNDTICLDSAGFTFETSVKLPDSDIIPNWYNTAWWFWLYSTSASGDVLVSLGPQNGSGLVAVTDHNRNPIILNEGTPGIHLNDWTNLKLQFRGSQLKIYINDSLWGQTTMHGPMTDMYTWSFTPFSFKGLIDYIKITNFTGEVLYHEEFNDPNNLAIFPDKARCESCQDRFTRYFNARNNSNLNFSEIAALYKSNACVSLNLCDEPAPTLCGRAEPLFPPVVLEEINNCSDSSFFIASKAQELHQVYLDSLKGHFDSAYIARCLEAYKHEKFEVRHAVNEFHHTLYYYDQAGNLIKTVPPAGVRANYDSLWLDGVALARDAGTVQVPAHELVTQYRYNTLNQVIASHSPDGGLAEFWYDRLGRLAISRNARQKAASTTENNRQYSYTWYDQLGRIVEVGQVSNTTANGEMTHAISKNATALSSWLGNLGTRRSQYIATWYDDAPIPPSIEGQIGRRNLRNRVSHTYYADTGNFSLYAAAIYYTYDILGNVDTILQDYGNSSGASVQNMMNVNNNRFKKIAYNYDLVSGKVNRVTYQPGRTDQWIHRYTYDAENRLTLVETSTDDMVWEKDARYEYYRHGPLARMTLGHQQVQAMDYAYTLQGWLKGINSTGGTAGHDMGEDGLSGSEHQYTARDAMGLTLNYFAGDYSSIGRRNPFPGYSGHMPSGAYRPLFNGNISSASVYQKKFEGANPLIFYNYKYDQLNRLTGQDAFNGFDTANNNWDALALMTGKLTERISYDGNGNIQTYERRSLAGGRMDELAYSYYPGTNRLNRVYDQVDASEFTDPVIKDIDAQDTDNYIYDAIGNLIVDRSEKIHIRWNVYGKITQIDSIISFTPTTFQTTPRIFYEYDALGNRIGQASKKGGVWYYTWYVRDAQGNILTTYTAEGGTNLGALNVHQQDRYVYGSSRVGSFSFRKSVDAGPVDLPTNRVDTFARGYREYELTNHLGNVLATVSDKKFGVSSGGSLIDYYVPDIVNATDYYPFGMPSRVSLTNGRNYKFGFGGKLMDNDVKGFGNQIDYGARVYDPRIGKFLSVDPLTRSYPWYTPYQYAGNTPIAANDLDGLEEKVVTGKQWPVKSSLNNAPQSNAGSTAAGMNFGPLRLRKWEYDESSWWLPFSKVNTFSHNVQVSAWNQTVSGLETGLKLLSKEGRKEIRNETFKNALGLILWLADTDDQEKWEYVKEKATDKNTFEDLAAGLLLGKIGNSGFKLFGTQRPKIPLSPSLGNAQPFKYAFQYGKCVEFVAEFRNRFAKAIINAGGAMKVYEVNIGNNGLIGTPEYQLANNGIHRFVEARVGNEVKIFDNFHPEGISREEYIKKIAGHTSQGQVIEGEALLKNYSKEVRE